MPKALLRYTVYFDLNENEYFKESLMRKYGQVEQIRGNIIKHLIKEWCKGVLGETLEEYKARKSC